MWWKWNSFLSGESPSIPGYICTEGEVEDLYGITGGDEKFKAGWNCVQNSCCSFLMGGRQHIYGNSFVCQQTGGQT